VRVRVLWFGRPAASPFEAQVDGYRTRVARRWPAEDCPLRPAAGGRDADPHRALALEAERVRQRVPAEWTLAILDEAGERMSSAGFADLVTRAPWRLGASSLAPLRAGGLDDEALFDVITTAAFATLQSRLAVALAALGRP